jgi:tRNA(fMet)-specific endonuclease VapC
MSPAGSEESAPAVLLDTNVVIALFAGDAQVVAALDAVSNVFIPAVVLGELLYGAQ